MLRADGQTSKRNRIARNSRLSELALFYGRPRAPAPVGDAVDDPVDDPGYEMPDDWLRQHAGT